VARASWPEEIVITGTLGTLVGQHDANPVTRTALILVGQALAPEAFRDSALYHADYVRRFRGQADG
jgi:precorrin-4/cobalt-precorrin-4 C11-methyltransferase